MRVYLDNCCYNRPYDDQSQFLVSLEAQSKMVIQNMIKSGQLELATSYMLRYENGRNPYEMRKNRIADFMDNYETAFVSLKYEAVAERMADDIMATGVKHADAVHVACAIISECQYFLTTDKRLLKYKTDKVKIMTPIDFIQMIGDEEHDE